ncbi:hypothetical protein LJR186_002407 [Microbacterium foliorum]
MIATQVSSRYVTEGDAFVDQLEVTLTKGTWTRLGGSRIPIVAEGTLYGPFDQQPSEADTPPLGAPVAGVEQVTLTGAGSYTSPGTIEAPSSGFYTWVWRIAKEDQGEYARYLTGSFTDRFGRLAESSVTPFQPLAVSTADQHLAVSGDPLTDTIVVSSGNGPWLRVDGEPIPVVFEGAAYRVPGVRPPTESAAVDPGAVPIGTVTITATGPGRYIAPMVVAPAGGFVSWVWEMKKASQPDWVRPYLADDWADRYGIPVESTSVRWPLHISSLLREYNVHSGGRVFDAVTVSGFPADHGDFHGDGYWQADTDAVGEPFEDLALVQGDAPAGSTVVFRAYGPQPLDAAPVCEVPFYTSEPIAVSQAGVYRSGTTSATQGGAVYWIETLYDSDEEVLVEGVCGAPGETTVVTDEPQPLTVTTNATPQVELGTPATDTATVTGSVPEGATLSFQSYLQDGDEPACTADELMDTTEPIPLDDAGEYVSEPVVFEVAGTYFWIETIRGADGSELVRGICGAPGETTIVSETPPPTPESTPPPSGPLPGELAVVPREVVNGLRR